VLKRKSLMPLILGLLLAVSLVGCSSSTQETSSKNTASTKSKKAVTEKAKTQSGQSKNAPAQPGNDATTMNKGTRPEQADGTRIIGQIVSVSNRSVTLALFDMPTPGDNGGKPSAPPSGNTPSSGNNPTLGNQPGGQTSQLSGEKKTITIPTSVKILSGGRESSTEVKISDLKAGQMLMVRVNSSSGAVEEVRVMEQGGGMGGPPPGGGAPGQNSGKSTN